MLLIQKLIMEKMSRDNITLSDIARATRLPKSSISNYYNNKSKPEGKSLAVLSRYLDCGIEDLLTEVDRESGLLRYVARNNTPETKKPSQMYAESLFASLTSEDQDEIIRIMIERKRRLADQTP